MTTPLPTANSFNAPSVTQSQFQGQLSNLLTYLSTLLGVTGAPVDARAALGLGGVPLNYVNRGAWASSTAYNVNDLVQVSGVTYVCMVANTSSGSFSTDQAAGYWVIYQGITSATLAASTGATLVGASGNVAWTTVQQFITALISSSGASYIGYTPPNTNAATESVFNKLGRSVDVTDWTGVDPTGATDSTTGLANAVAWAQTNGYELVFPQGTYKYATSPNFAAKGASYVAKGTVILNYTGSGNAVIFDGGTSGFVYNCSWRGRFLIQGTSTATHGFYLRSVHHSYFDVFVTGCNPANAAVEIDFSVCGMFSVQVSGNNTPFVSGATPMYGISLDSRIVGSNEYGSDNVFINPIIEGVTSHGIVVNRSVQNTFLNGTSEGNGGNGILINAAASGTTWIKPDIETNTGNSWECYANDCTIDGGFADGTVVIGTGCVNNRICNGFRCNTIQNSSSGLILDGIRFGNAGGVLTDNGTLTTRRSVWSITAASMLRNKNPLDVVTDSISVPNNTATTVLTLPSANTGVLYEILVCYPGLNNVINYFSTGKVYHDGTASSTLIGVTNGSSMTLAMSGNNVLITQTSGVTISSMFAIARAL